MSDMYDTWLWHGLIEHVRERYTPEQYEEWRFVVGTEGSDKERFTRGTRALDTLLGAGSCMVVTQMIIGKVNEQNKE